MDNKFPLTAIETNECPPHYWQINTNGVGECQKCGKKLRFSLEGKLQNELYREKSAHGGRIAQGKKRGRKKKQGSIYLLLLVRFSLSGS